MAKYFCYRRIPERVFAGGYMALPAYRQYMTLQQWIKAGKPTTDDITFYGQGRPAHLQKWWNENKKGKGGENE